MLNKNARLNRTLLILMIVLFLISLAGYSYANWAVEPEHNLWFTLLNALILSLPLVLFFGAIYVLVSAWLEHRQTGQISPPLAKLIRWAPRIASMVIIFFVSLFSLDVFEAGGKPLEMLGGFLIHNIPSILLIVLLIIAWRRPVVGFAAFLLAGIFFLRFVIFGAGLGHFMLFSGPMLLIAALFYTDWRLSKPQAPPLAPAAA